MPNGVVTYTDLTPSSIAMLECDPGYRPESSLNRTCGSDGHWSEEELSCVEVTQSGKYYRIIAIMGLNIRVNICIHVLVFLLLL